MTTITKNRDRTTANAAADRQKALSVLFAFADAHYVTDPDFKFNRAECYEQ